MLSLLRFERKEKNSSKPFRIRILIFLSYSVRIKTINTLVHSCSSLKNHTRLQTKISKVFTRFQTKTAQKPYRDGTYLYSLYTTASALPIFEPQVEKFNLRKQFIWDEVSKGKFIGLLKQDDFLLRLCQFETTTFPTDSKGVNLATEQFTDVISDICTQSLRLARKEKKTKVCKKWIDSDCASLRKPLNLLRKQFIWDEVSKGKFIGLLKQDDFLLRLCQFETTTFPTDSKGVNLATEQFTDVISDICTQSLRLARKEKKTKVCKKWIDSDCASLRKPLNLLSHKKHRNPFIDSNLRHDYHSAKKKF